MFSWGTLRARPLSAAPVCSGGRFMPPGRVAPNGGTRSQGGAVQIGCERADCDTNNARVDHSESGVCASSRQFLLQDDVSSGLSARRLDPRRRRAETGFAAGLDWDGAKWASARFSQVAFCVSPGPFFLKKDREASRRDITRHHFRSRRVPI